MKKQNKSAISTPKSTIHQLYKTKTTPIHMHLREIIFGNAITVLIDRIRSPSCIINPNQQALNDLVKVRSQTTPIEPKILATLITFDFISQSRALFRGKCNEGQVSNRFLSNKLTITQGY